MSNTFRDIKVKFHHDRKTKCCKKTWMPQPYVPLPLVNSTSLMYALYGDSEKEKADRYLSGLMGTF